MLVVAGILIAWREADVASIPIACFLLVNSLAIGFWLRRSHLSPFHGLMWILAAMAVAFPVSWFSVMYFASPQALANMQWPTSFYSMAIVVLIVPGTMLRFWIRERQALNLISQDVSSNV
jgi:hypothetical protein